MEDPQIIAFLSYRFFRLSGFMAFLSFILFTLERSSELKSGVDQRSDERLVSSPQKGSGVFARSMPAHCLPAIIPSRLDLRSSSTSAEQLQRVYWIRDPLLFLLLLVIGRCRFRTTSSVASGTCRALVTFSESYRCHFFFL